MKILTEFKKFAVKGNMIDMAVGIIIGAAFSTVVKSLVDDIIMPVIGKLTGGVDFTNLFIVLGEGEFQTVLEAKEAGVATLNYGLFINALVAFLIVSWVLFMVIKGMNKLKAEEKAKEATEKKCDACKMNIPLAAKKCPHCTTDIAE